MPQDGDQVYTLVAVPDAGPAKEFQAQGREELVSIIRQHLECGELPLPDLFAFRGPPLKITGKEWKFLIDGDSAVPLFDPPVTPDCQSGNTSSNIPESIDSGPLAADTKT